MIHRLVHVLVLLLLVGSSVNAQQRADFSIKQRAQSLEPYFVDSAKRYGIDPRILGPHVVLDRGRSGNEAVGVQELLQ